MAAKKPIYFVYLTNNLGWGMQPVKADNQKEARKKFKKRFPKSRVVSISKATGKIDYVLLQAAF